MQHMHNGHLHFWGGRTGPSRRSARGGIPCPACCHHYRLCQDCGMCRHSAMLGFSIVAGHLVVHASAMAIASQLPAGLLLHCQGCRLVPGHTNTKHKDQNMLWSRYRCSPPVNLACTSKRLSPPPSTQTIIEEVWCYDYAKGPHAMHPSWP